MMGEKVHLKPHLLFRLYNKANSVDGEEFAQLCGQHVC